MGNGGRALAVGSGLLTFGLTPNAVLCGMCCVAVLCGCDTTGYELGCFLAC